MFGSEAMAAMAANKQLQKGISPGVRASGPFAKQISQANRNQSQAAAMKNSMRAAAGNVAGKALGGMGSKFGK